jgi:type IV pilus assembly protein PilW
MKPIAPRAAQRGFTLVELLVAVAIGMILVLSITLILARSESSRRALTNANDTSQNAAFITFTLDRLLRSAGSGFVQGWDTAFGCRVNAARSNVQVLPATGSFPAPFDTLATTLRLAPVMVHAGAGTDGSDVLVVATGSGGMGESPLPVIVNSTTPTSLLLPATTSLRGGDLVLVHDGGTDCMVQQVASPFTGSASQTLTFGGTYAASTIGAAALANYYTVASPAPAFVSLLGSSSPSASAPTTRW